ncbi:MAG: hypothetical protein N2Z63_04835 [Thiobacillaceae bacterium]|nr:hypothetical protein [Thiobacillaceae bacterium]
MAKSRDLGICTFDQALYDLCAAGLADPQTALRYTDSYNELRLMLKNLVRRPADEAPTGLSLA